MTNLGSHCFGPREKLFYGERKGDTIILPYGEIGSPALSDIISPSKAATP